MYSTCMFCHASLGTNEALESFPIGRRLAFDATKGRLWVICRRCSRWNLSPLETRWEAVEECERRFAGTTLRFSTDHIGLARMRDGTDLVRIGEAERLETAAWRYGDQFGTRLRRTAALVAVGLGGPVVSLALMSGAATGLVPALAAATGGLAANVIAALAFLRLRYRRIHARIRTAAGEGIRLSRSSLRSLTLLRDADTEFGWAVRLHSPSILSGAMQSRSSSDSRLSRILTGGDAIGALRVALPAINADGASAKGVQAAVRTVERLDLQALLSASEDMANRLQRALGTPMPLANSPFCLALEMSLHEDDERRALAGELSSLESRWREAEEIATIADDLLLTSSLRSVLERFQRDSMKA